MDADHPVMIRPALAALSGVTHRSPCVSQRAIQHAHHALRVHGARRSCTPNAHHYNAKITASLLHFVTTTRLPAVRISLLLSFNENGRLTFRTEAHPCQVGLRAKGQRFTVNDLLPFLAELQKLHPESLIAAEPSPLNTTKHRFHVLSCNTTLFDSHTRNRSLFEPL